jgi:hypothetical protein
MGAAVLADELETRPKKQESRRSFEDPAAFSNRLNW